MSKLICILFVSMLSAISVAQDSTYTLKWNKISSFKVDSSGVWTVDQLNNVLVTHSGSVVKYDSVGVLKFQQSIKSYGKLKQIATINSMKLMYFSEEQQTICFLDNTLTPVENCIDLADHDITNAQWIAASSRPEMVWIYDNDNSTLKLISLSNNSDQEQEILNVKGILGIDEVNQIVEEGSNLYLLDQGNKIFTLDFYGGLLDTQIADSVVMLDRDRSQRNVTYYLKEDTFLMQFDPVGFNGGKAEVELPVKNVLEFKVVGDYVYLRTPKNVYKYILHFSL